MFIQNIKNQKSPSYDMQFRMMCEKDFGGNAWMVMDPMRNGEKISDKACYGCMVDSNNMICSKAEYEQWKMLNNK